MKRILLLKSSGRDIESYKDLLPYLTKPLNENKICFITTASHPEANKDYLRMDIRALNKIGFEKIQEYDIKDKHEKILRKDLGGFDIIFVTGGNTFYLLKHIRESGFNKVIKELIDKGVVYMGASAGSYVVCPTIEVPTWKNHDNNAVGLENLTAINLVPFLLFAHFTPEWKETVEKESKKTHYPIITLTNRQAVLCINGKYKIIGQGKKITLNNFRETL